MAETEKEKGSTTAASAEGQSKKRGRPAGQSSLTKGVRRLVDLIEDDEPVLHRIDDILNQDVIIEGAEEREGDFGPYVVMTINTGRGESMDVSTGARRIREALQVVIEQDAFPVAARFRKSGRAYFIT